MSDQQEPVVLELAPLPREQLGPFLLLGIDKQAEPKQIEAHWAQRVIWARKNQIPTGLGDINWAREVVNDPDRRVKADLTSLNVDTAGGVLAGLAEKYNVGWRNAGIWQPLDVEKPLLDFEVQTEMPSAAEIRETISMPEPPSDFPAMGLMLRNFVADPIDPWSLELPEPHAEGEAS